jgi:hypothetical protein
MRSSGSPMFVAGGVGVGEGHGRYSAVSMTRVSGGRTVYTGPRGGRYFLTPDGHKQYISSVLPT